MHSNCCSEVPHICLAMFFINLGDLGGEKTQQGSQVVPTQRSVAGGRGARQAARARGGRSAGRATTASKRKGGPASRSRGGNRALSEE